MPWSLVCSCQGVIKSSLNIFGLHIPYKEMQHDTRCCTFGLFDIYGKIFLSFVKNNALIISVQNVGLFSKPHAVQLKSKLGYELLFFAVQAQAPYWHSSPL